MTAIPVDTLRNVLEKIEEMHLPEGEYLTLANLLKTQHKKDDPPPLVTLEVNTKVVFVGKKALVVELHKRIVNPNSRPDDVEYSVNGVRKMITAYQFFKIVSRLYMTNLTKKMLVGDDDTEMTLKEFTTQLREKTAALEDPDVEHDDDDDGSYSETYVMSELFDP